MFAFLLLFRLSSQVLQYLEMLKKNYNLVGVTHCRMQIKISSSVGMADD